MLHNMGEITEVEYETNTEIGTEITTKNDNLRCHTDGLIFVQPGIDYRQSDGSFEHVF